MFSSQQITNKLLTITNFDDYNVEKGVGNH